MMLLFFVLFFQVFSRCQLQWWIYQDFSSPNFLHINGHQCLKKILFWSPCATEGIWLIANHSFFSIQDEQVETQMLFVNFFNYLGLAVRKRSPYLNRSLPNTPSKVIVCAFDYFCMKHPTHFRGPISAFLWVSSFELYIERWFSKKHFRGQDLLWKKF